MGLFGRRSAFGSDIRHYEQNVAVLKTMTENVSILGELTNLADNIRYSAPSTNRDVAVFDKRLASKLDDIKIALANGRREDKVPGMINDANTILAERNVRA